MEQKTVYVIEEGFYEESFLPKKVFTDREVAVSEAAGMIREWINQNIVPSEASEELKGLPDRALYFVWKDEEVSHWIEIHPMTLI